MLQELRQALRSLASSPGFSTVVILTLALAIGANTTIFALVHAVLLRPLPYHEPGRLVVLWESNQQLGQDRVEVSGLTFLDWRARTSTFERLAAWRYRGFTITEGVQAERVNSVEVAPDVFEVLGVQARVGRVFGPEDGQVGRERQVLLSEGGWRRRFGGDPNIQGRTIELDDETYTIAGVMPGDFQFPPADPSVELWSPLVLDPGALPSRPHRMYHAIGRLRPGASLAQARADMEAVARSIAREHPDSNAGWGVTLVGAREQVVGETATTLWMLFGAVVLVLLIACANIANLVLARSTTVSRDFAVRAALGAGRRALMRRPVAETALLALAGGAGGFAIAWWGVGALRNLVPAAVPRAGQIGIDPVVLLFTATVTGGAAVLFGLVPALRTLRTNVLDVLQEGGRGDLGGRQTRRLANVLVMLEVALALVLLVGAGLLLRSFVRLTSVDPGFRTTGVTAIHVALPEARYRPAAAKRRFIADLVGRVSSLRGVASAGAVSALPMSPLGLDFDLPFTVAGLPATSPAERPRANYRAVMSGYFETMGIPLKEGRLFTAADGRDDGPRVAIVNETAVRRYFAGGTPLGRVISMPMAGDLTIVGVVGDVRQYGLDATAEVDVFVPYFQFPLSEMQIVVRTDPTEGNFAPAFRTLLAALDPDVPMGRVSSIERLLSDSIAQPRFNTVLLLGLAACAALLAAVGVYGVVSYGVARRTPEIGLRMALGADAAATFRHVVGGAVRVVAFGVLIGGVGAALLGASLETLLFGVGPFDPATFLTAAVALLACGALAASVPARRAARIDPVQALRE